MEQFISVTTSENVVLTVPVSDILDESDIEPAVSREQTIQGVIKVYGYRKFCLRLKVDSISSSVKHRYTANMAKKSERAEIDERKFET